VLHDVKLRAMTFNGKLTCRIAPQPASTFKLTHIDRHIYMHASSVVPNQEVCIPLANGDRQAQACNMHMQVCLFINVSTPLPELILHTCSLPSSAGATLMYV
jgi:hypothetical protein